MMENLRAYISETTTTTDYIGFSQKAWEKILNGHNKTQKNTIILIKNS